MFITRIASTVRGRTTEGARRRHDPDGRLIAELSLACGKGTVKYPTTYVKVSVREELARKALDAIYMRGMYIEASGFLLVKEHEGEDGKSVEIDLEDVHKLKVFDRDGVLQQVLTDKKVV